MRLRLQPGRHRSEQPSESTEREQDEPGLGSAALLRLSRTRRLTHAGARSLLLGLRRPGLRPWTDPRVLSALTRTIPALLPFPPPTSSRSAGMQRPVECCPTWPRVCAVHASSRAHAMPLVSTALCSAFRLCLLTTAIHAPAYLLGAHSLKKPPCAMRVSVARRPSQTRLATH